MVGPMPHLQGLCLRRVCVSCAAPCQQVRLTPEMVEAHHEACRALASDMAIWTSHTVVIVDQSGSMRNTDVADASRSDVVWATLALDVVAKELCSGRATATDVFTLIGMNTQSAYLLHQRPMDWVLYNDLVDLLRGAEPKSHGHYLPACCQVVITPMPE